MYFILFVNIYTILKLFVTPLPTFHHFFLLPLCLLLRLSAVHSKQVFIWFIIRNISCLRRCRMQGCTFVPVKKFFSSPTKSYKLYYHHFWSTRILWSGEQSLCKRLRHCRLNAGLQVNRMAHFPLLFLTDESNNCNIYQGIREVQWKTYEV